MKIFQTIANELNIRASQVEKTVALIDAGNTIPFIARYRKEVTGSLTDDQLRVLGDRLSYLRSLEARRTEVQRLITELGEMTDDIAQSLAAADKLAAIEDIYRPYKPKRRTRATMAVERGLKPLAELMLTSADAVAIEQSAADYINPDKDVLTTADALAGASDIIAEQLADRADLREVLRGFYEQHAQIVTSQGKEVSDKGTYDMYLDYAELASKMPAHRVLAINRGERENCLKVGLELDHERAIALGQRRALADVMRNRYAEAAYQDAYKRLITPSLTREIRTVITAAAEEQATQVFGINLRQLLLQAPLKDKVVMGYDPAYRTGCKLAVIDQQGKLLAVKTIFPTKPQQDVAGSAKTMLDLIERFAVDVIAIGNGTASRESEQFVASTLKKTTRDVHYLITNEAGASVYSASELAAAEYPDIDVSLRGAISIGARVQDPLSELVKIDAKSIGVGQYQHDVNQKRLSEVLDGVVEAAVNGVGVNLDIASAALLSYVAGITAKTAKAIVDFRHQNGHFHSRQQLLNVKGIGKAAFEQAAGFLRLPASDEPLDKTGVHPESYSACYQLMDLLGIVPADIGSADLGAAARAQLMGADAVAEQLAIHPVLLKDLLTELDKPGRDPREDVAPPLLRADVLTIDDLTEGMVLKGTVRNVVDFGAFVDIGVKQDGLVHISELANRFVKRAMDVVSVGDIVDVKVIGIDVKRHKVSLSIKQV